MAHTLRWRLFLILTGCAGCIQGPPASVASERDMARQRPDAPTVDDGWSEDVATSDVGAPDPDILTLQFQSGVKPAPGYAGAFDVYLSGGNPDDTHAGSERLKAGDDDSALLAWDVSAIPRASVVVDATILWVTHADEDTSDPVDVYVAATYWFESEATWNQPREGAVWDVAGCRGASDLGLNVGTVQATGPDEIISIQSQALTDTVQDWVREPLNNNGVVLQSAAAADALFLYSRETDSQEKRPLLTVRYHRP